MRHYQLSNILMNYTFRGVSAWIGDHLFREVLDLVDYKDFGHQQSSSYKRFYACIGSVLGRIFACSTKHVRLIKDTVC